MWRDMALLRSCVTSFRTAQRMIADSQPVLRFSDAESKPPNSIWFFDAAAEYVFCPSLSCTTCECREITISFPRPAITSGARGPWSWLAQQALFCRSPDVAKVTLSNISLSLFVELAVRLFPCWIYGYCTLDVQNKRHDDLSDPHQTPTLENHQRAIRHLTLALRVC